MKLSVVINTKNSAQFLTACLTSLTALEYELVVVDMASTDDTVAIAEQFGATVYQYPHPEVGSAGPAREFAFARAHGDWILLLDSDEELTPDLSAAIKQIISGENHDFGFGDIYFFARANLIFGHCFTHSGWFPDYQPRLWRQGCAIWNHEVHGLPELKGQVVYLPSSRELAILHHNYQAISQFWYKANRYTSVQTQEILLHTKLEGSDFTSQKFFEAFFGEFWRRFFVFSGYEDGNHGLVLSLFQANYELMVRAKLWEDFGFVHHHLTDQQLWQLQSIFFKQAHYWWADLRVRKTTGLKRIYWQVRRKLAS